jgi:hypothetical protein
MPSQWGEITMTSSPAEAAEKAEIQASGRSLRARNEQKAFICLAAKEHKERKKWVVYRFG